MLFHAFNMWWQVSVCVVTVTCCICAVRFEGLVLELRFFYEFTRWESFSLFVWSWGGIYLLLIRVAVLSVTSVKWKMDGNLELRAKNLSENRLVWLMKCYKTCCRDRQYNQDLVCFFFVIFNDCCIAKRVHLLFTITKCCRRYSEWKSCNWCDGNFVYQISDLNHMQELNRQL